MRGLTFRLSGKTAFFKKPDANTFAYFTYNNIHKVALLGILGAIVGLKGYNQMKSDDEGIYPQYPEFYEKLRGLEISIAPLSSRGYFSKKIQVFNNSVGYASEESGGNLIVREQWLEEPKWEVFLLENNAIDPKIYKMLEDYILNGKSEYLPYLGKNDHIAKIDNTKIIELNKNEHPTYINSLFPLDEVKLDDELTFDDNNPFLIKEMLPVALNEKYNFYELRELVFTNLEVQYSGGQNVYEYEGKNLYFI
jgi:CRISPR-associated protein Cas5h